MKILVMGLPGAGKTWLSERLQKHLECAWYNADKVREMANDWDFSPEGRVRQAGRMKNVADYEKSHGRHVICDFVCPTRQTREEFNPDIVIWLNTINEGRFEDTNKMFEKPELVDWVIEHFLTDEQIQGIAEEIKLVV
jgi:adenylylsulfate kinase